MENFHIIVLCITFVALGTAYRFKDCGSKGAKLIYVGVIPCDHGDDGDQDDACILSPDKIYQIKVEFIPKVNSTKATNRLSIIALNYSYTLPDQDACEEIKCPIMEGIQQTIRVKIIGDYSYPEVNDELLAPATNSADHAH